MGAAFRTFNYSSYGWQTNLNGKAKTGIHSSANLKLMEKSAGTQASKTVSLSGMPVQTAKTTATASTEQPLPVQKASDDQLHSREPLMIFAIFMMVAYLALSSPVITNVKNRIIHRAKNFFDGVGNRISQSKKQPGQ